MVRQLAKDSKEPLSENFSAWEFRCRCAYPDCASTYIDTTLIDGLEKLRSLVGPLIINDGFRCRMHNSDVGGKPDSFHLLGMAADVRSETKDLKSLASTATIVKAFLDGGIGVYKTFVHLDCRGWRARWRG